MDLEFLFLDVSHLLDRKEMEQTLFDAADKILSILIPFRILFLILQISI